VTEHFDVGRFDPGDFRDQVRAKLFERRTVLLSGELDDVVASHAAAELMTLDASGDEPIDLHVDAHGGTFEVAFTLIDVIDLLGLPVTATVVGRAEGPAVGVLAVAGRRIAAPHARLRLCQPVVAFSGHARDIESWSEHHRRQADRFCARLARATGLPVEMIEAELEAGRYLDPAEARRLHLIDEIAEPTAPLRTLPRPGFGFRRNG
jgi:ATP-dependent Clp protease protease subunit